MGEAEKRRGMVHGATSALESRVHTLYDRAERQGKYAKEYAEVRLKAEAAGVPPPPRPPRRPREPKLTAKVRDDLEAIRSAHVVGRSTRPHWSVSSASRDAV